jgi:putative ABC transport system substrate-binding protein
MNRLILAFICLLPAVFLPASSGAQPTAKIPRVGWLTGGVLSEATSIARQQAFRQGLREVGYVDGKNILIEWRGAENIPGRRKTLAEELVRLKVEVIVTAGESGTRAARDATSTIPIVMASADDPIGNRFVASLARPDGNITGLSQLSPELAGKRLEVFKEVLPSSLNWLFSEVQLT